MNIRALLFVLLLPCAALGAEKCAPIRPQGLTASAIDALVLESVRQHLNVPIGELDVMQPLKKLDRTDNGVLSYVFVVNDMAEGLAIDPVGPLLKESKSRGSESPYESIPILVLQKVARQQYFAAAESDYPPAKGGTEFSTTAFSIQVPALPAGWIQLACRSTYLVFQNRSRPNEISAAARDVSLSPYAGEALFIQQGKQAVQSLKPVGYTIQTVSAEALNQAGPPCLLLEVVAAPPATPSANSPQDGRYVLIARFCYESEKATRGYSAMYSYRGSTPIEDVRRLAMQFISGVKPPK